MEYFRAGREEADGDDGARADRDGGGLHGPAALRLRLPAERVAAGAEAPAGLGRGGEGGGDGVHEECGGLLGAAEPEGCGRREALCGVACLLKKQASGGGRDSCPSRASSRAGERARPLS